MIKDRNIDYQYKRDWFPVNTFNSWRIVGGTTLTMTAGGSGVNAETTAGLMGVKMTGTSYFAQVVFPKPIHWDFVNDVHVRALWSDGGGHTDSVTFTFKWKNFSFGAANATADQTIQTALVADAHGGVANGVNATKWGTIDGGTIAGIDEGEGFLNFQVGLSADSTNMDPIFLGLEVAYIPKLTTGAQNSFATKPTDA